MIISKFMSRYLSETEYIFIQHGHFLMNTKERK